MTQAVQEQKHVTLNEKLSRRSFYDCSGFCEHFRLQFNLIFSRNHCCGAENGYEITSWMTTIEVIA